MRNDHSSGPSNERAPSDRIVMPAPNIGWPAPLHAVCGALAVLGLFSTATFVAALVRRRPAFYRSAPLCASLAVACSSSIVACLWRYLRGSAVTLSDLLDAAASLAALCAAALLLRIIPNFRALRAGESSGAIRLSTHHAGRLPVAADPAPAPAGGHDPRPPVAHADSLYRSIADALPHMVWVVDDRLNVIYVNECWSVYTGLPFEPGSPAKTGTIAHPDELPKLATAYAALRAGDPAECELRLRRHDGQYLWHLLRSVPRKPSDDAATFWIVTATEIEARKSSEAASAAAAAELLQRAHRDPLTHLPDRTKLFERITEMIATAAIDGTNVAIIYINVDHFKDVNETLGHTAGDDLLRETSARLIASLRVDDIASRVGGDEFVIACAADGVVEAATIAQRLQCALRAPFKLADHSLSVASSIGVSIYPTDGLVPHDLIAKADAAMYSVKNNGRDAWAFYNHKTAAAAPQIDLVAELREAIAGTGLVVYFQPIVDVASGRTVAAEALVRWAHPQRGLLLPAEFIALAEAHGMIAAIGEFVIHAACATLGALHLRAGDDFSIAVNVSAHHFTRPSFVGSIATAVADHGIESRRLEIEITESVVAGDAEAVIATVERLKELGVRVSIDDFGTGYSSLAYIKQFAIHTLKIDRSFVIDIASSHTDQAIATTIITLAHSLGMRTIAEGVETREQLDRLRALGADCAQGYLLSRPLAPADFARYMDGRRSAKKLLV